MLATGLWTTVVPELARARSRWGAPRCSGRPAGGHPAAPCWPTARRWSRPSTVGPGRPLLDLGQVGVHGPAVGLGLGRRGGQQLVALAEHCAHAQAEPDQVAGRAALGQSVVLGQHRHHRPWVGGVLGTEGDPPAPSPPARRPPPGWPASLVGVAQHVVEAGNPRQQQLGPLSMVPTLAISRVRCRLAGVMIAASHSSRLRSSPMPHSSPSDRWMWALTSPGSTTPGRRRPPGPPGDGPRPRRTVPPPAAGEDDRPVLQGAGRPHGQHMPATNYPDLAQTALFEQRDLAAIGVDTISVQIGVRSMGGARRNGSPPRTSAGR
jgi:hypothetical protein